VQLRVATKLTCEAYISQQAWEGSSAPSCPWHPGRRCGFRRHTAYRRKEPADLVVPRWYCRKAHATVSLLPTFAASRVADTLDGIEDVVATFEQARQAGATVAEAAQSLRPSIELQGALRWLRRRLGWVHAALMLLAGCAPEVLAQCELLLRSVRGALGTQHVLLQVREIAAAHLHRAPAPLGLVPATTVRIPRLSSAQHKTGPDPPE